MAKEDHPNPRSNHITRSVTANQAGKNNRSQAKKMLAFRPMITLLLFSTAMLVLPLATYFLIRWYIINSPTYSAMGSIVVVQIIIAAYIYRAWHDEKRDHEIQMKEKLKKN